MAKAPPETRFRKEDFPSAGLGSQDALDTLFLPLNAFLRAVRDALNGGLTADNAAAELKVVTITTPPSGTGVLSCFPLKAATSVKNIVGVSLVGCLDLSTAPGVPALGVPSWTINPDGSLQITNIPGLLLGRAYRVTLKIEGG